MLDALSAFTPDRSPGAAPLPTQVAAALRKRIADGTCASGSALPSSRRAAAALGLSRGTVTAAYDQLVAEGYLVARDRSGMEVAPRLAGHPRRGRPAPVRPTAAPSEGLDFTAGAEPTRPVDDPQWRSSVRAAIAPGGPRLEEAIATHLRTMRAMPVAPEDVVVTAGARAGLTLILREIASAVGRPLRVAVESPGFPGLRRVLEALAADPVPIDVTSAGLDLAALDAALPLDLVLVTPNHQFPSGGSLQAKGRQDLIAWAGQAEVLIVEDDYDSQYRHLGPPLPTLWEHDPHAVAHLGTFSAVLGRDVGTGYLIVPEGWREGINASQATLGNGVPPLMQRAMARYLQVGGLRRRIVRARRSSAAAAEVMAAAVPELVRLLGAPAVSDSGHLLVLELAQARADRVRAECASHGVQIADLSQGWAGGVPRHGVLLNYGGHCPADIAAASSALTRVLKASSQGHDGCY